MNYGLVQVQNDFHSDLVQNDFVKASNDFRSELVPNAHTFAAVMDAHKSVQDVVVPSFALDAHTSALDDYPHFPFGSDAHTSALAKCASYSYRRLFESESYLADLPTFYPNWSGDYHTFHHYYSAATGFLYPNAVTTD
jgi:hypothetical protein